MKTNEPAISPAVHPSPSTASALALALFLITALIALAGPARAELGWVTLLAVVLLAPVTEEILFRGWLWESLSERFSVETSWLATSAAFGALHVVLLQPPPSSIPVMLAAYTAMGMLFGFARWAAGVLMAISVHGIGNAAIFMLDADIRAALLATIGIR